MTDAQKKNYGNPDNDTRGSWNSAAYTCAKTSDERPNLYYPIVQPNTGEQIFPNRSRVWAYNRETHLEHIANAMIYWGKDGKSRAPRIKKFLTQAKAVVPRSIWSYDEAGHNSEANLELRHIFASYPFTNPKPVRLIDRILRMATNPNDLVLDFFAGSGTTAHAVHKLNAEDGGRRRVILVSNTEAKEDTPDKNLCRDVCAARVRRVIEGYTPAEGEPVPGLGGDFAYLRTRRIPAARLLEIEHAEVWTALQLMHGLALSPYAKGPFAWAGDEDEAVMYLPRFRRADAPRLRQQLKRSAAVVLYSWQPRAVEQLLRASHVTHLQIPETLARRFGLGQGGKP
jgi:adenine-specific DNA-methyltransferase